MMKEDKEKEIYKMVRKLKKGSLLERKKAIKCEKVLADEGSNKNLSEKLNMVMDILEN